VLVNLLEKYLHSATFKTPVLPTDVYSIFQISIRDAIPPVHVVSNNLATKLTTQNDGMFTN